MVSREIGRAIRLHQILHIKQRTSSKAGLRLSECRASVWNAGPVFRQPTRAGVYSVVRSQNKWRICIRRYGTTWDTGVGLYSAGVKLAGFTMNSGASPSTGEVSVCLTWRLGPCVEIVTGPRKPGQIIHAGRDWPLECHLRPPASSLRIGNDRLCPVWTQGHVEYCVVQIGTLVGQGIGLMLGQYCKTLVQC